MDKWKNIPLTKEEEEGITAAAEEVSGEEVFQRTLAGRLWTTTGFNSRAFTTTIIGAWKLKNGVEVQELNKNLFLFRFATKREMEWVLRSGPWSFDRHLLVLDRVSGEEQPSNLNMHFGTFWTRVYDLPLMLRSETMARKLGQILGTFEEIDMKEGNRSGRFLRIRVTIDLNNPLKRGTVVRFKDKTHRVHFKYERLPTFCFICGRIGHQLKDCEALGDLSEEGFEDLDEQELSYGMWLRASPLPKVFEDQKSKEGSSGTCSRSLFQVSSSQSRCNTNGKEKEKDDEEIEVTQMRNPLSKEKEKKGVNEGEKEKDNQAIENVAESLGAVIISESDKLNPQQPTAAIAKKKKWSRKKPEKKIVGGSESREATDRGKRQLVEVPIKEVSTEEIGQLSKKRRQPEGGETINIFVPEVVLETQHRLPQ
ncbi:uncharacterized protein LOC131621797 [Vicia villosa]|uniref:uncharacterized protein LOC131621797 n=1 Tax=Vicia villosa TaxID=3911 RepID=UPI00273B5D32|nr:uncharacterized protein LOC131621797 [Vicia villosa]